MGFEPRYTITSRVARDLMRIEAARQAVAALPLNEGMPAGLRRSARLASTHYSAQADPNACGVCDAVVWIPCQER
jgi:hypothetical protein